MRFDESAATSTKAVEAAAKLLGSQGYFREDLRQSDQSNCSHCQDGVHKWLQLVFERNWLHEVTLQCGYSPEPEPYSEPEPDPEPEPVEDVL